MGSPDNPISHMDYMVDIKMNQTKKFNHVSMSLRAKLPALSATKGSSPHFAGRLLQRFEARLAMTVL
jgi:hypothetical protein